MAQYCLKNFHRPLPEKTHEALRAEAERAKISTAMVGRETLEARLLASKKLASQETIQKYAGAVAGTSLDLDPVLETAAIREILAFYRETC